MIMMEWYHGMRCTWTERLAALGVHVKSERYNDFASVGGCPEAGVAQEVWPTSMMDYVECDENEDHKRINGLCWV